MKTKAKQPARDKLLEKIVTNLKKKGVRCGFGDEIEKVRKMK